LAEVNNYLFETANSLAGDKDVPFSVFDGKRVVITGSTGLIGSQLVRVLLCRNEAESANIELVLPVRNTEKARSLFGVSSQIQYIRWSLDEDLRVDGTADYFVHAACSTSSKSFQEKPATTILQIVNGGAETLRCANELNIEKYLFLSTMEVYGETQDVAYEGRLGNLDPMMVRNSYPEAKKLTECLCASWYKEFGLPTVIVRLAQTFGQGVDPSDMRVFADFARGATSGTGITLLSDGTKRNSYLSVDDAVRAIIFLLAKGEPGEAYNAANDKTYCSIKEMAELVLRHFGTNSCNLTRKTDPKREATFRKSSDLRMDTSKLENLGWEPQDSLANMYTSMIKSWNISEG
jgi:UDP-glucuronate decarboxylase